MLEITVDDEFSARFRLFAGDIVEIDLSTDPAAFELQFL